ncbi:hypothetical protein SAMN04487890_101115, partial [Mucilaginibacter polytrichastri]
MKNLIIATAITLTASFTVAIGYNNQQSNSVTAQKFVGNKQDLGQADSNKQDLGQAD